MPFVIGSFASTGASSSSDLMRSSRQHYRAGRSRSRRRNRSRRLQRERQTLNALVPVSQPTPAAAIADSLEDEHTVVETGTVAKRVFECQLAHGSSTVKVAGFNNNAELYQVRYLVATTPGQGNSQNKFWKAYLI